MSRSLQFVYPNQFESSDHYYTRVLNAQIHPLVAYFFRFDAERIVKRFCHLNPMVDPIVLKELLTYKPRFLKWAGGDLFHVTTEKGIRRMVVIEVNSSPSGIKAMPTLTDYNEKGGYDFLITNTFAPMLSSRLVKNGRLAVLYDKNLMEASGYAAAMADHFNEKILLTPFYQNDESPLVRYNNRIMEIRTTTDNWEPIRGAFRYVTQRPWNRIPIELKTPILNPTLACLAGGRNKMVAAMAYELLNAELKGTGLQINFPETIRDATKEEIPLLIKRFGGHAVIKNPYSNAGQGVYTITSQMELDQFMTMDHPYNQFIVQSLIGNYRWSSEGTLGKFYHVGTVPNRKGDIFVSDLRMMICSTPDGFRPLAIYCRKAAKPLADELTDSTDSWEMLGTNLSVKIGEEKWSSDTGRLLLMDRKEFNSLGIGLDDLVNGFIQVALGVIAIDKMAHNFMTTKGKFRMKLFKSINRDKPLLDEILI